MAVDWIDFRFPGVSGVRCAFTHRPETPENSLAGNISFDTPDDPVQVLAARRKLLVKLDLTQWIELKQVHGTRMVFGHLAAGADGTGLDAAGVIEADGHGASRAGGHGRALVIKTADCQPILIAHKSGDYVAALHVGWRGNATKFIQSGIAEFCARYDIAPGDLHTVRGPSLGPTWAEFVNFALEWPDEFAPYLDQATMMVDLWRLTRDQLVDAGVPESNIHAIKECTREENQYFSHRRGDAGRQASLIWME